MALQKSSISVNFAKGLDTKTDPFQIQVGNFLALDNMIFDTGGQLKKRNGFSLLTSSPGTASTFLTTFNGNLTAIGSDLQAYSQPTNMWLDKGPIQRVSLNTLPLIRSSINQSQADSVTSNNGFVCTVYTDQVPSGGSVTPSYKYAIADAITGQNIIEPTVITPTSGSVIGAPRVFLLGSYFIIAISVLISATDHLQYIAISTSNPTSVLPSADISTLYTANSASSTVSFDGYASGNYLYFVWRGSDGSVKVSYLTSNLQVGAATSFATQQGEVFSVTVDTTPSSPVIYGTYFNTSSSLGYIFAVSNQSGTLNVLFTPQIWTPDGFNIQNIATTAQNGICTIIAENLNNYGYDNAIQTDYLASCTVTGTSSTLTITTLTTFLNSVGLASKAFLLNGTMYVMATYSSTYQPTYFLIDSLGNINAKLAYSNGGGYLHNTLPNISISNNEISTCYLIKDLIAAVNKNTNVPSGNQVAGIYSQTGVNLVTFTIGSNPLSVGEIGQSLNISGALVTSYDGYTPVEQGFNVWPDSVEAVGSGTSGSMSAQQYFYQATYEWIDNQGNNFRSAPSIPVSVTLTSDTSVSIFVPTLRLTYKTANPVTINIYRWSVAQQVYYQVTSIIAPILNDLTIDYITFVDTNSDATILGNNILYTTGGVIENIGPPATDIITLFQQRLWLVDSEDKNLLWYSKQIIEATPVEMSNLLTLYVAPTTAAQGSTGPITALASLDDKLIIFKNDAIYYINGQGPDNTGANNNFSEPVFITATVGCSNQQSIVFMPQGLMFQSSKGIWLLDRNLSTSYIGAPVEAYNSQTVTSANNIPGTNQIRFTMNNKFILMYDYYYQQWGTFSKINASSSTLYNSLHTYLTPLGQVFQELPGTYLDGSVPVLMSFTTGWLSLAGLQGYERFYQMLLLGKYITPFNLNVQLAYNFLPPSQYTTVSPPNAPITWGSDQLWGSSTPWGGTSNTFESRIFPNTQKVESFQISINELFDPSFGTIAGAGLTLSGMNLTVGIKKGYRVQSAAKSFG